MTPDAWLVLTILVAAALLFVSEKLPADLVAMLVLGMLLGTGLLSPQEALAGFSSEATITVAAMFVLSAGIQRSGAMLSLAGILSRLRHRWQLSLAIMLIAGFSSVFVNNTAIVAVLLPLVLAICSSAQLPPSRFLIPLSYAAQLGGVCTLIGTSSNLLVNSIAAQAGLPAFDLFEFSALGATIMVSGFIFLLVASRWLLPDRPLPAIARNVSLGAFATELRVLQGSQLVGKSWPSDCGGSFPRLLALMRQGETLGPGDASNLTVGDVLLVEGDWPLIRMFCSGQGLALVREQDSKSETSRAVVVEAVIAANGHLCGKRLGDIELTRVHQATLLAIQQRGLAVRGKLDDVQLGPGDLMLMAVPPSEMSSLREDMGLIVISERAPMVMHSGKAAIALSTLAAAVAVAALGWLSITAAALIAATVLVITKTLKPEEAYAAIDWRVIFLLAGMIPLGLAMDSSGLADNLVAGMLQPLGDHGPWIILAVLYLLTAVLTEFMSNNASVVLLAPIAIGAAATFGVDAKPFLLAVMFAASTSFATPVGYQTNTMVYNAGGYRFSDFMRIGIPLNIVTFLLSVFLIPHFFPFNPSA